MPSGSDMLKTVVCCLVLSEKLIKHPCTDGSKGIFLWSEAGAVFEADMKHERTVKPSGQFFILLWEISTVEAFICSMMKLCCIPGFPRTRTRKEEIEEWSSCRYEVSRRSDDNGFPLPREGH